MAWDPRPASNDGTGAMAGIASSVAMKRSTWIGFSKKAPAAAASVCSRNRVSPPLPRRMSGVCGEIRFNRSSTLGSPSSGKSTSRITQLGADGRPLLYRRNEFASACEVFTMKPVRPREPHYRSANKDIAFQNCYPRFAILRGHISTVPSRSSRLQSVASALRQGGRRLASDFAHPSLASVAAHVLTVDDTSLTLRAARDLKRRLHHRRRPHSVSTRVRAGRVGLLRTR